MAMIERDALIVNPLGMHVRPGAEFVKVSNKFKAAIEVHKDGAVVNGKSILGMMTLAAECGSTIRIRTDGEDAEQAMVALLELVAAGFHEMHLKPQPKEKEDA
jgi:phosphocarrier protein